MDFIRAHGITRLPPGPAVRMTWRGLFDRTEEEYLADASRGSMAPGPTEDQIKRAQKGSARARRNPKGRGQGLGDGELRGLGYGPLDSEPGN
jgi:hypothetical protein